MMKFFRISVPLFGVVPSHAVSLQLAFGDLDNFAPGAYTLGTDGPAHLDGSLSSEDNRWISPPTSGIGILQPTETPIDTRNNPLPSVTLRFGSVSNSTIPFDFTRTVPFNQSGAASGTNIQELDSHLFQNHLEVLKFGAIAITGLPADTYSIYSLFPARAGANGAEVASGLFMQAEFDAGVSFEDPGLDHLAGSAFPFRDGVLDLGSEYLVQTVTVTDPAQVLLLAVDGLGVDQARLSGVQIVGSPIPESSTGLLTLLACGMVMARRRSCC